MLVAGGCGRRAACAERCGGLQHRLAAAGHGRLAQRGHFCAFSAALAYALALLQAMLTASSGLGTDARARRTALPGLKPALIAMVGRILQGRPQRGLQPGHGALRCAAAWLARQPALLVRGRACAGAARLAGAGSGAARLCPRIETNGLRMAGIFSTACSRCCTRTAPTRAFPTRITARSGCTSHSSPAWPCYAG